MRVIDFRVRPLVDGYRNLVVNGTTDKFLSALGFQAPPSVRERSLPLLLEEMDAAGIDIAVVPGRQSPSTFVPNPALLALRERYPERFVVFAHFDPLKTGALAEQRAYLAEDVCGGVSIEPGFGNELRFDDPLYTPLYELLSAQGRPLMVTFSGSITSVVDPSLPTRLHAVAKAFPTMNIIVGHGGWPWARELIMMAFFQNNLYLLPDLYATNCPGSDDYRIAANHMLRERMLFGSSYPLVPVGDALSCAKAWKLDKQAEEAYLYRNASRLLGLGDGETASQTTVSGGIA